MIRCSRISDGEVQCRHPLSASNRAIVHLRPVDGRVRHVVIPVEEGFEVQVERDEERFDVRHGRALRPRYQLRIRLVVLPEDFPAG